MSDWHSSPVSLGGAPDALLGPGCRGDPCAVGLVRLQVSPRGAPSPSLTTSALPSFSQAGCCLLRPWLLRRVVGVWLAVMSVSPCALTVAAGAPLLGSRAQVPSGSTTLSLLLVGCQEELAGATLPWPSAALTWDRQARQAAPSCLRLVSGW